MSVFAWQRTVTMSTSTSTKMPSPNRRAIPISKIELNAIHGDATKGEWWQWVNWMENICDEDDDDEVGSIHFRKKCTNKNDVKYSRGGNVRARLSCFIYFLIRFSFRLSVKIVNDFRWRRKVVFIPRRYLSLVSAHTRPRPKRGIVFSSNKMVGHRRMSNVAPLCEQRRRKLKQIFLMRFWVRFRRKYNLKMQIASDVVRVWEFSGKIFAVTLSHCDDTKRTLFFLFSSTLSFSFGDALLTAECVQQERERGGGEGQRERGLNFVSFIEIALMTLLAFVLIYTRGTFVSEFLFSVRLESSFAWRGTVPTTNSISNINKQHITNRTLIFILLLDSLSHPNACTFYLFIWEYAMRCATTWQMKREEMKKKTSARTTTSTNNNGNIRGMSTHMDHGWMSSVSRNTTNCIEHRVQSGD